MHRRAHAVTPQRGEEDGRGADAVCIVIAEHGDKPALRLHFADGVDEFAHAAHEKGRKEILPGRVQKTPRLFGRIYPAGIENFCSKFPQPALPGNGADFMQLFGSVAVFRRNLFHFSYDLSEKFCRFFCPRPTARFLLRVSGSSCIHCIPADTLNPD